MAKVQVVSCALFFSKKTNKVVFSSFNSVKGIYSRFLAIFFGLNFGDAGGLKSYL